MRPLDPRSEVTVAAVVDQPLAFLGGPAVRPQGPPTWPRPNPAVLEQLVQAYHTGDWGQYCGAQVATLEAKLTQHLGAQGVYLCGSGTFALELALRALGIGPGDEVIMSAYEYEPSFLTLHALGAKPVLVDCYPERPCLDPRNIAAAISPKTKAILATHLHGAMVDIAQVRRCAEEFKLRVIEDAAQVPGARLPGGIAGSLGDLGIMSFGGSKPLSAGRGGALIVSERLPQAKVKMVSQRGIQQIAALSELQAAALIPQIDRLEADTRQRHLQVEYLRQAIADLPGLTIFENQHLETIPGYYKVGCWYNEDTVGLPRDVFTKALRAEGIAFDPGFRSLHVGRSPTRFRAAGDLSQATRAHQQVVMLHHPVLALGTAAMDEVAWALRKVLSQAQRLRAALERTVPPRGTEGIKEIE